MESHLPIRHVGELKAMRFDEASATVWYWGFAELETASPSMPVWQIRRITVGPGANLVVAYADGDAEFDNVWNSRASLSYS